MAVRKQKKHYTTWDFTKAYDKSRKKMHRAEKKLAECEILEIDSVFPMFWHAPNGKFSFAPPEAKITHFRAEILRKKMRGPSPSLGS